MIVSAPVDPKSLRFLADRVAEGHAERSLRAARLLARYGAHAVETLASLLDPATAAPLGRRLAIAALEAVAPVSPAARDAIGRAMADQDPTVRERARLAAAACVVDQRLAA